MAKKDKEKDAAWSVFNPPEECRKILESAPRVIVADNTDDIFEMAVGGKGSNFLKVTSRLPDGKDYVEATVARVRNGIAVNYPETYMRRRDPDTMTVADDLPTDKPRFKDRFGETFDDLRQKSLDWLGEQELATFAFYAGWGKDYGKPALAVAPANAAFFPLGLALLQGIIPLEEVPADFKPEVIIYVAPIFRHTYFGGKQIVVHNRKDDLYEMFSYNLYPGPSAKKGVYGSLIHAGEKEGWVAAHCSAVQVVTPYDNVVTIMHEGASGGGKSEMLEEPHRNAEGHLVLGRNVVTGDTRIVDMPCTCNLRPICDDIALCHTAFQKGDGRLGIMDAEAGWFVRVNHITHYGTEPHLEKLTVHPPKPLLFLNIDADPGSRALIWEHIEDKTGVRCPNPRVILPREMVPNVVEKPVSVDIRSFGIRTPPCTRGNPSYGILGILHVLPPALAWLWRLVAPRGHANPSIVETEKMSSEGVGSYEPFAAGRRVAQANLLLDQIQKSLRTRYILVPNQHIGAWEVSFMPQWLAREYLTRRGSAKFTKEQIVPARCSLLGFALRSMRIEGERLPNGFLEVNTQPEVGDDGYDQGAEILREFFHAHLTRYLERDLSSFGRQIINCCLDNGTVEDYMNLLPVKD